MKILLLEDDKQLGDILVGLLTDEHHQVTWVENGFDGLQQVVNGHDFELIISDNNMPLIDGITFIKELRNYDTSITVIMFTADIHVQSEIDESMLVSRVIFKDIEELLNVVCNINIGAHPEAF